MSVLADKYQAASTVVLATYPAWKKIAVEEDRAAGRLNTSIMVQFAKDVEDQVDAWEKTDTALFSQTLKKFGSMDKAILCEKEPKRQ